MWQDILSSSKLVLKHAKTIRSAHYPMKCNMPWTSGCLQYPCPLQKHGRSKKSSGWCRPAAELCDQSLWPLNHIQYISIHENVNNAQQSAATCQFELQASSSSLLAPSLIHVPIRCAQHHFSFANRQIAKYRRFSHGNQPSIVFINLTHCLQTPRTTVIPCLFAKLKVQQALPPSKFCFKGLEHGIGMHLVYFQLQRKPWLQYATLLQ